MDRRRNQSNYDQERKRYSHLAVGWNVWGFHELGLFWWVPQSNYNQKKGAVVWPLVAMSDCFGGFLAMFFGGFLNQITNYDQKKGTVIWPSVGMLFVLKTRVSQSNYKLRPERKGTVGPPTPVLFTPFATHVTFCFYYVCT
jgi:hypothetical protein